MPRCDSALARQSDDRRFEWIEAAASEHPDDGADIRRGLLARQKKLPCRLFYDERGSRLFERICDLPEYYPTRTERALLAAVAAAVGRLTGPVELVELGSGSSVKTRILIDAYRALGFPLRYLAIDVSASSLQAGAEALLARYPTISIGAVAARYEDGLAAIGAPDARETALPRLLLFLGSTIGNFTVAETEAFLARVRASVQPGDMFLVGTDLEKDPQVIEAAYNDAAGVTAAFNLNMLRHINYRFRGDFKLDRFAHRAIYDRVQRRIEMRLVSLVEHVVTLATLDVRASFQPGEWIETEISRKFDLGAFGATLARHGFGVEARWTDPRNWFGLTLARAI